MRDTLLEEMHEEEIIKFEDKKLDIKTIKRTGLGKTRKYYIQINNETLVFTPRQN